MANSTNTITTLRIEIKATGGQDAKKVIRDVSAEAEKAASSTAKYDKATGEAAKSTQKATAETYKLTKTFRSTTRQSENATKASKGFLSTFGKYAKLTLFRMVIRKIFQEIKEDISVLAVFDKKMGDIYGFNKALSDTKSRLTQLGGGLSVTISSLLAGIAPALNFILDILNSVVDAVNRVIAALRGQTTYAKINSGYWKDYAAGVKETKRQLMGFDELNALSDNGGTGKDGLYMDAEVGFGDFKELGLNMDGFLSNAKKVIEDIKLLFGDVKELINGIFSGEDIDFDAFGAKVGAHIGQLLTDVLNTVSELLPKLTDVVDNITQSVTDAAKSVIAGFFTWLEDTTGIKFDFIITLLQGAIDRANEVTQSVTDNVSKVLGGIVDIVGGFITGDWTRLWQGCKSIFVGIINSLYDATIIPLNGIIDMLNTVIRGAAQAWAAIRGKEYNENEVFQIGHIKTSKEVKAGTEMQNAIDELEYLKRLQEAQRNSGRQYGYDHFASGGTPTTGQLFWANEAGPELVGTVGGRTTVTNQDQFTQGLADANEGVISAVYAMANAVVNAINNKDTSLNIDGYAFARTMNRKINTVQSYAGSNLVTGV